MHACVRRVLAQTAGGVGGRAGCVERALGRARAQPTHAPVESLFSHRGCVVALVADRSPGPALSSIAAFVWLYLSLCGNLVVVPGSFGTVRFFRGRPRPSQRWWTSRASRSPSTGISQGVGVEREQATGRRHRTIASNTHPLVICLLTTNKNQQVRAPTEVGNAKGTWGLHSCSACT